MTEELVIVRQLPEIEEHLKAFKADVDQKVGTAMQMVCTEETLSAVKTVRAELGKDFKALEEQRKEVKKKILAPYDAFEKVYAECVSDSTNAGHVLSDTEGAGGRDGMQTRHRQDPLYLGAVCRNGRLMQGDFPSRLSRQIFKKQQI